MSVKEQKAKPRYNMWQNSAYMIALAWKKKEKKVLVFSLLEAIFFVAGSLINLYISPMVLSAVENKVPLTELLGIILGFTALLILCSSMSAYIQENSQFGRAQLRIEFSKEVNHKELTTSYINLGNKKFNDLCAETVRITGFTASAAQAIWVTLTTLLQSVIGFVIYMALLFSVDTWIVGVILATTLAGYFIGKYLNEYEYRHREEAAEQERKISYINTVARQERAAKDIRMFGLRPWLEEIRGKAMKAYHAFQVKANARYMWAHIADLILAFLRNGIVYAYLIGLVLEDGLSASQFLLYFSAVGGFTEWISAILGNLSMLNKQSLDLSTLREFIEFPEPFSLEGGAELKPDNNVEYEIKVDHVSFHYPETERNILEDVCLTIHPGEKLAVVGLNGAGKTTLVKLICGFYDPTEGRILLNGRDIREFNRRDYYKMFSAVFQDFAIMAGTIAMNVAQSEDCIDMDKVKECVEKAGLKKKIESLAGKYETHTERSVYEDGVMLSGGETQRLMLARALYKDAPVIVLDEPTAALDPVAEAELYEKYNEMTDGKLSVYISHRLASTRFCDRILFIENKGIAEEGTHEELLQLGGRYAEMFEVQSKYYRNEVQKDEEQTA